MSMFSDSTQRRHWMFTRSELAQRRQNGRLQYDRERALYNQGEPADGYLSHSEQDLYLYYYQKRIADFAAGFSLPTSVVGTAMVYYKRFYLNRTVMDEDPRLISISSLLMATKSEEAHIRVGDLARSTQISVETLLEFEQILLEGINFHLKVHIPFRAINGFINELHDLTKAEVRAVQAQAENQAVHALYTDAIFLYTPSQIALVCVQRAAKTLRLKSFSDWFSKTFASHSDYLRLMGAIKDIDEMIESVLSRSLPNQQDLLASLKNKRDQCRNLIRDPTSDLAKRHREKMEQEREERRLKKHIDASSRSNSFLESMTSKSDVTNGDDNEFVLRKKYKRDTVHKANSDRANPAMSLSFHDY